MITDGIKYSRNIKPVLGAGLKAGCSILRSKFLSHLFGHLSPLRIVLDQIQFSPNKYNVTILFCIV